MTQPAFPVNQHFSAPRIVVGVDGSASSVEALTWAVRQAMVTGAEVEAVMCWHHPPSSGMEISVLDIDGAATAETALAAALEQVPGGVLAPVTTTVTFGRAADVLVAAATDAQLLVVGSRGHGSVAGALLGSVSQQVIAHARCPVVVIKPGTVHLQERRSRPRSSVASTAT